MERSLDLVDAETGALVCSAALTEEVLPKDKTSDTWWRNHTFNGYSPSGNATAPLVYANFGLPEDFEALAAAGVSVKGAVVLMRYGKCFRGLKAMNAEHAGALGAVIFSDPAQVPRPPHHPPPPPAAVRAPLPPMRTQPPPARVPGQDGYAQGSVYPDGPWRPKSAVQRGSIQFISVCAGPRSPALARARPRSRALAFSPTTDRVPQVRCPDV